MKPRSSRHCDLLSKKRMQPRRDSARRRKSASSFSLALCSHTRSFARELAELRTEGWTNITSATLSVRYPNPSVCECAVPKQRGAVLTPAQLFWYFFSPELCALLLKGTNREVEHTYGNRAQHITIEGLRRMIGFYVTAISRNEKQIKAFALRFTGADWAVAMYAKFVQCLTFDAVAAFDLFNLRLQSAVTPGGMLVVDESMWDWQSGSATVVFIPRKPTDQGVKVQTGCLSLTRTNEPYCYYMKPDIGVTKMGPEAVLSDVITYASGRPQNPRGGLLVLLTRSTRVVS